ncbi:MAG: tetratricopeptide repeat protein [Burkholderiales bacterium]
MEEPEGTGGERRTFLFTDIEGSTRLWESSPALMRDALAAHDALARETVAAHGGTLVKMVGDGMQAVFADTAAALAAALAFQRGLTALSARAGVTIRARCGLHRGRREVRDGDHFGSDVVRATRIMAAGHGGQVLTSDAVANDVRGRMPDGAALVDLGVVRLRDLARPERLWQVDHPGVQGPFPPLRSLDAAPNNLPLQLTSLLGREDDARALHAGLAQARLVTLTGPGGIGKTRLAVQVAGDVLPRFPDGAWFVDLASLVDAARVPAAVAQVLAVAEAPDLPLTAAVAAHVAPRSLLLVLDNCEHLRGAAATVAAMLLAAAPGLVVLATSREVLGLPGERIHALAPLPVPAPTEPPDASPAVQLFVERARETRPGFVPTAADLAIVGDIARRLDGIPLALELAAARMHVLALPEIAARLADRFRLLSRGPQGALPRQRTLEALIAWSYDLLAPVEQQRFAELSVFAGGFDLPGAEAVCADPTILDTLDALVGKSLVVAYERGAAMRYRMLDTLREYAQARLADAGRGDDLRDRHAQWCLALATEAHDALRGPRQAAWIERLDAELDNLRAALAWTAADARRHGVALALSAKLWRYWHMTGRMAEGRAHVERALDATADLMDPPLARADALYAAGALAKNQSDLAHAARRLAEAGAAFEAQARAVDAAAALGSLGNVRQDQGDFLAARELQVRSLALFRAAGDRRAEATALLNLGSIANDLREWDVAQSLHEDAIALARELGVGAVECLAEANLGELARDRGDARAARARFERALAVSRAVRFTNVEATALTNLAALALADGDRDTAAAHARAAIVLLHAAGAKAALLEALETAAEIVAAGGGGATALGILAATAQARDALALPWLPRAREVRARVVALTGDRDAAVVSTLEDAVHAALGALPPGTSAPT